MLVNIEESNPVCVQEAGVVLHSRVDHRPKCPNEGHVKVKVVVKVDGHLDRLARRHVYRLFNEFHSFADSIVDLLHEAQGLVSAMKVISNTPTKFYRGQETMFYVCFSLSFFFSLSFGFFLYVSLSLFLIISLDLFLLYDICQ